MKKVYKASDSEFYEWISSEPSEQSLLDALRVLEEKKAALWDGSDDSYRRDRYDLDANYMLRIRWIKSALAVLWIDSGQVEVVRGFLSENGARLDSKPIPKPTGNPIGDTLITPLWC